MKKQTWVQFLAKWQQKQQDGVVSIEPRDVVKIDGTDFDGISYSYNFARESVVIDKATGKIIDRFNHTRG